MSKIIFSKFSFFLITIFFISFINKSSSQISGYCNITKTLDDSTYCFKAEKNEKGYWTEYVKKCEEGKICAGDAYLKTCKTPKRENLPPGEYCEKDEECFSNSCKSDKCKGKEEKETCENTFDCDPGLFCNKEKKCESQKSIGDSCENDDQCPTNADCHKQKCTEVLTLKIGEETKKKYMCKTYYVAVDDNGISRCASLKSLDMKKEDREKLRFEEDQKLEMFECKTDVDICRYEVDMGEGRKRIYTEGCQCSLAFNNRKFCKLGTDMPSHVYAKNLLKMAYWRTHFKAHRAARELRLNKDDKVPAMQRFNFPKYADVDEKIVDYYESGKFLKNGLFMLFIWGIILLFN